MATGNSKKTTPAHKTQTQPLRIAGSRPATAASKQAPGFREPIGLRWWIEGDGEVRVGWPEPSVAHRCEAFGWLHATTALGVIEAADGDRDALLTTLEDAFPGREWSFAKPAGTRLSA